jgi:hypothetical protein
MRALPELLTPEQFAEHPLCQQAVQSQCVTCQGVVMKEPNTDNWLLFHSLVHSPCGHSTHCTDTRTCPGCGLFFVQCKHCRPRLCDVCTRAAVQQLEQDGRQQAYP